MPEIIGEPRHRRKNRISDILPLLEGMRDLLGELGDRKKALALGKFIEALGPFGDVYLDQLPMVLRKGTDAYVRPRTIFGYLEPEATMAQLQNKATRDLLSREALATAAQKELGVSKWRLLRMNREAADAMIERALQNIRTLDTIAKNASKSD